MKYIAFTIILLILMAIVIWLWNRRSKVKAVAKNISDQAESVLDAYGKKETEEKK